MKQSVTIVGAIEGSYERTVEKEYLLMIRSLRENGGAYANAPVVLLQPTENDISPQTMVELGKLGVTFMKDPIAPSDTGRGFLNMPYTCEYLAPKITTDHMVWLDCDTIILQEPDFMNLYDHEVAAHCKMLNYRLFFNHKHEKAYHEDAQAQRYLKELVVGRQTPDYFKHINTWFIQASPRSKVWNEWAEMTRQFVALTYKYRDMILSSDFTNFSGQGRDLNSLGYALSSAEEIGMGLLEAKGKYEFREPIDTRHQYLDKHTRICHYDDWSLLKKLDTTGWAKAQMKEIDKICR
jgi:hypothetical protein